MFCRQAKEVAINRVEAIGSKREKLQDKHKSCQTFISLCKEIVKSLNKCLTLHKTEMMNALLLQSIFFYFYQLPNYQIIKLSCTLTGVVR